MPYRLTLSLSLTRLEIFPTITKLRQVASERLRFQVGSVDGNADKGRARSSIIHWPQLAAS